LPRGGLLRSRRRHCPRAVAADPGFRPARPCPVLGRHRPRAPRVDSRPDVSHARIGREDSVSRATIGPRTVERRCTMGKKGLAALALAAGLVWGAAGQDAQELLGAAAKAMGVDTLKTVQYSATGLDFALGQAPNPSAAWPKFINKSYTRAIDFEKPASKVDRVRVQGENPPHGGGQQPIVGEQPQSQIIVVNASTPWAQELEIVMLPHGFVRAAAANNATVESKMVGGKKYQVV